MMPRNSCTLGRPNGSLCLDSRVTLASGVGGINVRARGTDTTGMFKGLRRMQKAVEVAAAWHFGQCRLRQELYAITVWPQAAFSRSRRAASNR